MNEINKHIGNDATAPDFDEFGTEYSVATTRPCNLHWAMIYHFISMMIPTMFQGDRDTGKPPSHGLQPRIRQAYDLPPKSQGHFREVTTTNRPSGNAMVAMVWFAKIDVLMIYT